MIHKALCLFKTWVKPFWTKRRVKGGIVAYLALMPFGIMMTGSHETFWQMLWAALVNPAKMLPIVAVPFLAALALFDWRQGKRMDLRGQPPERIALTLALGCLLPLVALRFAAWLLDTVMLYLDSFVSTFRFLVWSVFEEPTLLEQARRAGVHNIQIVSPAFRDPISATSIVLPALGRAVAEIPAWFALWGFCFIIAATERKVDGAIVRAYIYGVALALVPYTVVQNVHGWLSDLEQNLSPTITPPFAPPLSAWFSLLAHDIYCLLWDYLEIFAAFAIWAVVCWLLWKFFQRSRWWQQRLTTTD